MAEKLNIRNPFTGEIRFTKVTGAGNDFILFDALNQVVPMLGQEIIQKICTRGLNIGADGVLVLSSSQTADFKLHYFNADGTSGMLCANGARCAVLYAKKFFDIIGDKITFECCGEIFTGEILDGKNIRFKTSDVKTTETTTILFEDRELDVFIADTGAPHLVLEYSEFAKEMNISDNFDTFDVNFFGSKLRYNSAFAPHGINVNFVSEEEGVFKIRTFERGVERETLACGTGILASAIFLAETKNAVSPVEFVSRSKKKFLVEFGKTENGYSDVYITGEAEIVYYGEIIEDKIY